MNFKEELAKIGIVLSLEMEEKFEEYFEFLVAQNEVVNLTALTKKEDVYLKHFYDSLALSKYIDLGNKTLCDVGAGAGFPSIPLKIINKDLKVTIVDSLKKRCDFLEELVRKLALTNVRIVWGRAEEFKQEPLFDVVTARAVARLNILDELCIPLVKKNGYFIAMKGSSLQEELEEASGGIKKLGGEISSVFTFKLPIEESERGIVLIKKALETPDKYPRSFAKIKKNPL